MSFHAGLFLVYSISSFQTNKQASKQTKLHSLLCELFLLSRLQFFIALSGYILCSWGLSPHYYLRSLFMFCVTPSPLSSFLPHLLLLYWFQMPSVLLWFCYLWVLHLLKYVLISHRNGILFLDRQISHKNEISVFV